MTASNGSHWMADLVLESRGTDAPPMDLPAGATVAQAWHLAAKAVELSPDALAARVATRFRLELADLQAVTPQALRLLPERVARRHQVLPLRQTDRNFYVATADPLDEQVEKDIGFATGRAVVFEIASPDAIADALNERYGTTMEDYALDLGEDIADAVGVVEGLGPESVDADEIESAPVVRLTTIILRDAVRYRASDIHIEPGRGEGVVRYRIDGVMRSHMKLPMVALNRVVSRIKVLGKLDISDRMRPQDGRARVAIEGRAVELRISTVPTRESEKAVLRVLAQQGSQKLEELGLLPEDLPLLRSLINHRNGIVLVTGPTGSGKTTTLYATIRKLAGGELNVMTVEDPIEYEIPGITQIQVETRRNVTFASALRAILRQDPDVVLVGEIRDQETARIALQASMTGHLVLATLHTNDAASAALRLADLGVDRTDLAGSLRGVLAQRLIRSVCSECAVPVRGELDEEERTLSARYGVAPTMRSRGCPRCGGTGFAGRIPVLEILVMTPDLSDRVARGDQALELGRAAVAHGMRSLVSSATLHAAAGRTTLQEVQRVIGDPAEAEPEVGATNTTVTPEPLIVPALPAGVAGSSPPAPVADTAAGRVLVVDDDPVHRAVASRILKAQGFVVEEATNGGEALQRVATSAPFDLVLTDLSMPGMGGHDVVSCLRAMPRTANTPIVVATSEADEGLEVTLMDAGADDYIRKPIDPARFTARIKAALRRTSQGRAKAA